MTTSPRAAAASGRPGDEGTAAPLAERELTALWLLGRVPAEVLPVGWTLLRPGRAGRGAGPDVREAAFRTAEGAVIAGDVEVHLRASDWTAHGHAADPVYDRVRLHLVWRDDGALPGLESGAPLPLPGGDAALTAEVAPALSEDPRRLRRLLARGASGCEPCAGLGAQIGIEALAEQLRREGQRRLAERVWAAAALVEQGGWVAAWEQLLERALRASAGRRASRDAVTAAEVTSALLRAAAVSDDDVLRALRQLALDAPSALIEALCDADGSKPLLGRARAAEVGWNAALPLLMAAATAYDDAPLARACADLAARWPAPRPYGRTTALRAQLTGGMRLGGGALAAQGLLLMQDLWCERGGCGVCPLSRDLDGASVGGGEDRLSAGA